MAWWSYKPGRHSFSHFFSSGRQPLFFTPTTRQHPRGLSGHIPKHAAVTNPYGNQYAGRRR